MHCTNMVIENFVCIYLIKAMQNALATPCIKIKSNDFSVFAPLIRTHNYPPIRINPQSGQMSYFHIMNIKQSF